jgi:hypothetical protein
MDIRIINRKDEIMNVSGLSIKVIGKWLVGMTAEAKIVEIEEFRSEEKAREILRGIANVIDGNVSENSRGIVFDLRGIEEEEEGEGE